MSLVLTTGSAHTIAELDAVTKKQVAEVSTMLSSFEIKNEMWSSLDIFKYEGFEPEYVYKHVALIWAKEKAAKKTEDDMKKDLFLLLGLQIEKGNITVNNYKGFKPEAQTKIVDLISRWKISLSPKEGKRNAVTLPRLAAAFPIMACRIAEKRAKKFHGAYGSSNLPQAMLSGVFASLIPSNTPITDMLLTCATAYACDQGLVIGKVQVNVSDDDEKLRFFTENKKFTDTAFNSAVLDADQRLSAVKELLDSDDYEGINKCVVAAGFTPNCSKKAWDKFFA